MVLPCSSPRRRRKAAATLAPDEKPAKRPSTRSGELSCGRDQLLHRSLAE